MKKEEKTNVCRVLDAKKIDYTLHTYEPDPTRTGAEIASMLGEEPGRVFKTLVTQGKSGAYYVFAVPVAGTLDLKKAAKAAGEKSVTMIKQKELLPLTGYVHGGCSPIGMKKPFKTFIHETAPSYDTIFVSAGKVGFQIELAPGDLTSLTGYVHGGCSPIGMKKAFPTFLHETAADFARICVSAGKVGLQIDLATEDLVAVTGCRMADVVED